jgi:mycothiol synthase
VVTCDGDKLIGYCWTEVIASGDKDSRKQGQIYMIGTDPDYRGTGAGKRVLLAGLFNLRNRGVEITTLTVDSENEVALALYESIGFYVTTTTLWYEKKVDC